MRALMMVAALGGAAFAEPTLRATDPIVIEGERPATLLVTQPSHAEETTVFDTLGFVDATLSAVEPRGGLTRIKLPTMKLRRAGARPLPRNN